jgi:hypothetical protein
MGNGGFSTSCRAAQIERHSGRNDGARDGKEPVLILHGPHRSRAHYVHYNTAGRNLRRFIRCNPAHGVFV